MKTSELIGPALAWAAGICNANPHEVFVIRGCTHPLHSYVGGSNSDTDTFVRDYAPHENWAQGGPIIERERISIISDHHEIEEGWLAESYDGAKQEFGPTPLVAAMRCYVASKLGDDIEIPEELK